MNQVCVVLRDITSLVNLEGEFLKRNRELMITSTLSSAFISSEDINSVFNDLLEKVLVISDLSIGWIVIRQNDSFILKSATGASLEFRNKLESGNLDFIYDDALKSGEPLYVLDPPDTSMIKDLKKEGIVFFSLIPLKVGNEVLGFLVLASRIEIKFDFDFASLISLIGNNLSLIAEKIRLFQETRRLAITDDLTELYNVRYFYDVLNSEIAKARRYSTLFSIVLFDVDNFKAVNDTYGHQAGDEILRSVAGIFKSTSRASDVVARYGGEEFITVLPSTPRDKAFNLAVRVMEAVEQKRFLGEESVGITLSGGIATFPEDASDAKSLLHAADMAMYAAKKAGKKQINCYRKQ